MDRISGKSVLVTGACGTVGRELIRQLVSNPESGPVEVLGIDNNESQLFYMDQEYRNTEHVRFAIADIRDLDSLKKNMTGTEVVFHAAALKHVVMCESAPDQAVKTNINGVQNVIDAAVYANVEVVMFTSSDKAVNPTSVMGTSKLMGERLITAANNSSRRGRTVFTSTRFGNVLGSTGSVVPIFKEQIRRGGPVTITDEAMTRFVMSIDEAVSLVIDAVNLARGGEIFITKMPVVSIVDLADAMISVLAPQHGYDPKEISIEYIGTKAGEKLYEELISEEEIRRTLELPSYYSVLPAYRGIYKDIDYSYEQILHKSIGEAYTSGNTEKLSKDDIVDLLNSNYLIDTSESEMTARYWPGDKGH